MGYRLTRIYTRQGDAGTTGLADGSRLRKDSPRIHLIGELDELNSHIGLLLEYVMPDELRDCLGEIQHLLFDLGGDLSIPGRQSVTTAHVAWLESWLDHFNDGLPPLREFILPGGTAAAAHGHLARTICRRAERTAVGLLQGEESARGCLAFLNRLSDFLFVASRILARLDHGQEIHWVHERIPPRPPVD